MWLSLAAAVNARMSQVGLDQADLAEASGLSAQVVRDLQRGMPKRYRSTTMVRIARALDWPADAFPRILNGLPVEDEPPAGRSPHRLRSTGSSSAGPQAPTDRRTREGIAAIESQVEDLESSLADLRRQLDAVRRGA